MALSKNNPTTQKSWKNLEKIYEQENGLKILDYLNNEPNRVERFSISLNDFYVDFSKNRITKKTLSLFDDLAQDIQLQDAISKYFGGEKINETENRAVLHTALRVPEQAAVFFEGKNITPDVYSVKEKIKQFTAHRCNIH